MELDEIKNIWKEKKAGDVSIEPSLYNDLLSQIKKAEKKVIIRYVIMSFFMTFAFYVFTGILFSLKQYEDLTYVGIYLLLAAMISVFIIVWSTVIILKKGNISNQSIDFLKSVRKKLLRRRLIRKIIIPIYLAAITIGITLVYIEALSPYTILTRILVHILVVLLILGISIIAYKRERKRDERIFKPIENRINELLKDYDK